MQQTKAIAGNADTGISGWQSGVWIVVLVAGVAAMAIPTFQGIARVSWSTEQGGHGPIVLAIAIWLLVRAWPEMVAQARPGSAAIGAAILLPALALYVAARVVGSIVVESAALYLSLIAVLYLFIGKAAMRAGWFPLVYFLLVLPPPGSFVAAATQPLRLGITEWAVLILSQFGYPVARSGLSIVAGQYSLEVKAACGGLNSMISLTAMGLFYAWIRHSASVGYNLVLFASIIAMAIMANLVRVILLILITYHLGDRAAQGFLHDFAGLTMVAVAMGGVIVVDELLSRRWRKRRTGR